MITVENKDVKYILKQPNAEMTALIDKEEETNYLKLIIECCNKPSDPKLGFSYDDIKQIDRVRKAIDSDSKEAEFEDADFAFIKSNVINRKWPTSDIQFVEFVDYIKNLTN